MNEQVERRLEAESSSESKGYFANGLVQHNVVAAEGAAAAANAAAAAAAAAEPTRWTRPPTHVAVSPRASIGQLIEEVRSLKG